MQSTLSFGQKPLAANPPAKKRPLNETHATSAQASKVARPPSAKAPDAPAAAPTFTMVPSAPAAVWAAIRQQQAIGISSSHGGSAYRSLADRRKEEEEILARSLQAPAIGGGSGSGRGQNNSGNGGAAIGGGAASQGGGGKGGGGKGGWRKLPGGEAAYVTASGKRLSGKVAFAAAARDKRR